MNVKDISGDIKKKEILFILSCDEVVSVNSLYSVRVGKKNGKAYPIIYKSNEAQKFCNQVNEQLLTIDFKTLAPWLFDGSTPYLNLTIQYVVNHGFGRRDTSNMIKCIEDCIFGHTLGLNDSRNVEIHCFKSFLPPTLKNELIMIRLSESTHCVNYMEDRKSVV